MRSHISPAHVFAALLDSVLSLCGPVVCFARRRHVEYEHREVWGRQAFCERCGKTLEVGR